MTIQHTTPIAADAIADAVSAEVARLKSPEPASPNQGPSREVIGKRIEQERTHGDAWIKANLTREQRRALSITVSFGPINATKLWNDEPPLKFDTWDDLIENEANAIVMRRRETGCPTFDLWGQPAPKVHVWPPVTIRPTTDEDRAKALAKGTRALARLVAGEERKLRSLRALLHLACSIRSDAQALTDPASIEAWASGLDVLTEFYAANSAVPDAGERLAEDAQEAEDLAIVSGDRIFMSGGDIGDDFYAWPRSYVDEQIAEYGEDVS